MLVERVVYIFNAVRITATHFGKSSSLFKVTRIFNALYIVVEFFYTRETLRGVDRVDSDDDNNGNVYIVNTSTRVSPFQLRIIVADKTIAGVVIIGRAFGAGRYR